MNHRIVTDDDIATFSWPPNRVRGTAQDKIIANTIYGSTFLGFVAMAMWMIKTSVEAPPSTVSEFVQKDFPFPVVSICGDYWSKRNHTFGESRCKFYKYTSNETTDDDYYDIDVCDDRVFTFEGDSKEDIFDYGGVTGPCLVFNGEAVNKKVTADTEGKNVFDMAINLDLSEANEASTFCSVCGSGNMPKQMIMVLSEKAPWEDNMGYHETYHIKPSGYITAKISKLEENYLGKKRDRFSLTTLSQMEMDRDGVLFIELQGSTAGVHEMTTTKKVKWFELFGSIMGLFGYVTLIFTLIYKKDQANPYFFRRLRTRNIAANCKNAGMVELGIKDEDDSKNNETECEDNEQSNQSLENVRPT